MIICLIARLFGLLWFSFDLSKIVEPSKFWQEIVKGILLLIELVLIYRILCRTSSFLCFFLALGETLVGILLGETINNYVVSNLFYMACILFIPVFFVKTWFSFLENVIMYAICMLYGIVFLVGKRMENPDGSYGEHFTSTQIKQAMQSLGVQMNGYNEKELCLAANMLYSDYSEVLKPFIPREKEAVIYVNMARAFLDDPDAAVQGGEKLAAYYYAIVDDDEE